MNGQQCPIAVEELRENTEKRYVYQWNNKSFGWYSMQMAKPSWACASRCKMGAIT
jgi:hypothetical protein